MYNRCIEKVGRKLLPSLPALIAKISSFNYLTKSDCKNKMTVISFCLSFSFKIYQQDFYS